MASKIHVTNTCFAYGCKVQCVHAFLCFEIALSVDMQGAESFLEVRSLTCNVLILRRRVCQLHYAVAQSFLRVSLLCVARRRLVSMITEHPRCPTFFMRGVFVYSAYQLWYIYLHGFQL